MGDDLHSGGVSERVVVTMRSKEMRNKVGLDRTMVMGGKVGAAILWCCVQLLWAASVTAWHLGGSGGGSGDGDNSSSGNSDARDHIAGARWCDDGV